MPIQPLAHCYIPIPELPLRPCVKIQSDGVAVSGLQAAPVGIPLRVHAAYQGDSYNVGNYSGWAYFILR